MEAVWEIVKARDRDGVLPALCWTPEYLAVWTHFATERGGLTGIKRGMQKAVEAGLVEELEDGSVRIHDWDQYQLDKRSGHRRPDPFGNAKIGPPDPGSSRIAPDRVGSERIASPTGQDRTIHSSPPPEEEGGRLPIEPEDMKWRLWRKYQATYENVKRRTPPQSASRLVDRLEDFRRQLDFLRSPTTSDEDYIQFAEDSVRLYLAMDDEHVRKMGHDLGTFVVRLPGIIEQMQQGARP